MATDTEGGAPSSAPDVGTSTPVSLTPDTSADPGPAPSTTPPASPSDAPVDDHSALLEAVQKVVEPTAKNLDGEAAPAGPKTDATQPSPEGTVDPLDADPGEQELGALIPKTRKRMERLIEQRNSARAETETLKEPAAKWSQFYGYLEQAQLAPEDVNLLLGVGAHLRAGRMKEFRDGIAPYWRLANEALGDFLPQDLQAKVDQGEITNETAAEMSRLRYANARLQGQAQATDKNLQDNRQQQTANAVRNAVTVWEEGVKQRDPDYARKAAAVLRISQALMLEHGAPQTPEAAVELAKRAYVEAGGWAGQFTPPPQPTRPVPDSTRVNGSGARPEPRNLMEAAMLGLERSRATRH
jgi:hypothetical protein